MIDSDKLMGREQKNSIILSEKNISNAFTIKACHEVLIPSNSNQITFHLN